MNGLLSVEESISKRLYLAEINKQLIDEINKISLTEIVDGIIDFINILKNKKINIYIISGGFIDMIKPVAKILGIPENNIFANNFKYFGNNVIGAESSLLLKNKGKAKIIENLKNNNILKGINIMLGDGYTDFETIENKTVEEFICCAYVIERHNVVKNSKYIARSIEELKKISYNIMQKYGSI